MRESSPQNYSTVAVAVSTLLVSLTLRFIAARQMFMLGEASGEYADDVRDSTYHLAECPQALQLSLSLRPFVPDNRMDIDKLVTVVRAIGRNSRTLGAALSISLGGLEPMGVLLWWPSFEGETLCFCCEAHRVKWA